MLTQNQILEDMLLIYFQIVGIIVDVVPQSLTRYGEEGLFGWDYWQEFDWRSG